MGRGVKSAQSTKDHVDFSIELNSVKTRIFLHQRRHFLFCPSTALFYDYKNVSITFCEEGCYF